MKLKIGKVLWGRMEKKMAVPLVDDFSRSLSYQVNLQVCKTFEGLSSLDHQSNSRNYPLCCIALDGFFRKYLAFYKMDQ